MCIRDSFDGKVHKFVVNFLCILTENDRLPDFERILAYFTGPVSYTHLDVYKRQVYECKQADACQAKFVQDGGKYASLACGKGDSR